MPGPRALAASATIGGRHEQVAHALAQRLATLMTPRDYFVAAEDAFRAPGEGGASTAASLHIEVAHGVFHAKGGTYKSENSYAALKLNANFPGNPERTGLPPFRARSCSATPTTARLLCILDSAEVTLRRTAALNGQGSAKERGSSHPRFLWEMRV